MIKESILLKEEKEERQKWKKMFEKEREERIEQEKKYEERFQK